MPRPTALRVDTCVCLARSEDTEKLSHSTRSQHRREILGLRQQAPGGYRPHRRRHRRRYSRGPCATRRDAGFGQPGGGIRKPRGRHRHRPPTGRLAGAGTAGCATGRRASNMRAARYGGALPGPRSRRVHPRRCRRPPVEDAEKPSIAPMQVMPRAGLLHPRLHRGVRGYRSASITGRRQRRAFMQAAQPRITPKTELR